MSTPTKERVAATREFAAAATEAEYALAAAVRGLQGASDRFNGVRYEDLAGLAAFNTGRLLVVLELLRPLAADFKGLACLYRRVAAAEQSSRDAHRELYGEEAR